MRPVTMIVCLLLALPGTVRAQTADSQAVNVDDIWKSISAQPHADDEKRATISRVLDHPAAREIARAHHLDLDAAMGAVNTLDGSELESMHQRAAAVESALAGGDRVVISTTVIIIVLLVVILLLVAD